MMCNIFQLSLFLYLNFDLEQRLASQIIGHERAFRTCVEGETNCMNLAEYKAVIGAEEPTIGRRSLEAKVLEFLCDSPQEIRDASRGRQILLLRVHLGHGTCADIDCEECIAVAGSGLRTLQRVQNTLFNGGVFRASKDVIEGRMKLSAEWSEAMTADIEDDQFKKLPQRVQSAIIEDIKGRTMLYSVSSPEVVENTDTQSA